MNNLELLKLNRTIHIALLDSNKILEAISAFENYQKDLLSYKPSKSEKEDLNKEINHTRDNFLNLLLEKANTYIYKHHWGEAAICYTYLFKFNQSDKNIINNYIRALNELKQYDLSISVIDKLIEIYPADIEAYRLYADVYQKMNNIAKAIEYYEKYIALKDKNKISACDYNQLGFYYDILSRENQSHKAIQESFKYFVKASEMNPTSKLYSKNITIVGMKAKEFDTVMQHWDNIIKHYPLTNDDKFDYAINNLKIGNLEKYYEYVESRFFKKDSPTSYPKLNKPRWKGEDISDKTLLVHYEQGFGDTILISGYLERLKKKAKNIIVIVQNELVNLLSRMQSDNLKIYSNIDTDIDGLDYDYHIPMMSVLGALNLNKDNISVGQGYLQANEDLVQAYKEKYFNHDKIKIGISCCSDKVGKYSGRDIHDKDFIKLLDNLKNAELYFINKDIDASKFSELKNTKVVNLIPELRDFDHTAAVIENCDIVLTTDNVILNLAGALGKKTFALFNWYNEWRWFDLTGDNVIWYTSVKPFVNDYTGNWEYSLNKAIEEINSLSN